MNYTSYSGPVGEKMAAEARMQEAQRLGLPQGGPMMCAASPNSPAARIGTVLDGAVQQSLHLEQRACALANHLTGPVPEPPGCATGAQGVPDGIFGEMERRLEVLVATLERLSSQIGRVERAVQ